MLKDLKYKDPRSWELMTYHRFVGKSMIQGFKWTRYKRSGNHISIYSLANHYGAQFSVISKECADRYERWYKWMKRNEG